MSRVVTPFEQICAAMVEAMDPDLRLAGAELEFMAADIARRISPVADDARATVLTTDRLITVLYAEAGKPYGPGPEARWRWFFERVDA